MSFSSAPADVLGSIFHFLGWPELNTALQCNRLCYAVVCQSMLSIQGRRGWREDKQNLNGLSILLSSPLAARHIGHFTPHRPGGLTVDDLTLVVDRLTRLRTLEMVLLLPSPPAVKGKAKSAPTLLLDPALRFPATLTSLNLYLSKRRPLGDGEAALISTALARCVSLQTLQLDHGRIPLRPLTVALPHLHTLCVPFSCLLASEDQSTAIRSLPALTALQVSITGHPTREQRLEQLRRLTATPHSLQLKRLEFGSSSMSAFDVDPSFLSDDIAECLARIPTLQSFECNAFTSVTQLHWLRGLEQLTTLSLMWLPLTEITPDAIVTAVRPMNQMRTLSLSLIAGMRSSHLTSLLGGLDRLTALTLVHYGQDPDWLDSLRFLTDAAPALQKLDYLHICRHERGPNYLDSRELLHVLACKSLSDLKLLNVFAQPMDEALLERIKPECPELPFLRWRIIEDM